MNSYITVIGGGLAGCESAVAAAKLGIDVILYEMRPKLSTPVHHTDLLAELVCSNSFKSMKKSTATGLLKEEMLRLNSLILRCAHNCTVEAGDALAVDRTLFAKGITEAVLSHPRIKIVREEVRELKGLEPVLVATGPLTSDALSRELSLLFSRIYPRAGTRMTLLSFYDAISPIVSADSIGYDKTFRASRYRRGEGDYINCPLTPEEYRAFVEELKRAEVVQLHPFEKPNYFEGCIPIEEMARRGEDTMRFGPMKPVGLRDPRTGRRPYAVAQLRAENKEATMYNMVGFQTRLKWGEQKRIFRMIPALAEAEFLRYGQVHRNTFINSPLLLLPTLQLRGRPGIFIAGQLIGVEGYIESAASGILAGINAARLVMGLPLIVPPATTTMGSLIRYVTGANPRNFQPMNANFGLLPPLEVRIRNRLERNLKLAERALSDLDRWLEVTGLGKTL